MKTVPLLLLVLTSSSASSCESPPIASQTPGNEAVNETAPLAIRNVVRNKNADGLTITFSETMTYDPALMEIAVRFFNSDPTGFVPIEKIPNSRWIAGETGHTPPDESALVLSDIEPFSRVVVELTYDTKPIKSVAFEFEAHATDPQVVSIHVEDPVRRMDASVAKPPSPTATIHFDDPSVGYHTGLTRLRESEKTTDRHEKILLLEEALSCFVSVSERFPEWNTEMVNSRATAAEEALTKHSMQVHPEKK